MFWQHSISADFAYSLYKQTFELKSYNMDTLSSKTETEIDSPNLEVNAGYKLGFYPNSRTQVTLSVNAGYNQFWGNQVTNDENEIDIGSITLVNSVQLHCYYYISPQLRFSLNLGSTYTYLKQNQEMPEDTTGDETRNDFRNNISASLTYSIF